MDTGRQQSLLDFMGESTGAAPPADPLEQLAELKESCLGCSRCGLRRGCTQVFFGEGNPRSLLMLVGEGPGAEEDRLGRPFVGAAGQLLNRIIESLGWRREDLYIANIVKCRPPGNRLPLPDEVEACLPYLKKQIELINPALIVCLGSLATKTLVDPRAMITRVRGRCYHIEGRDYMPTFHPAALLRDSSKKRPVWEDFKEVKKRLESISHGGS